MTDSTSSSPPAAGRTYKAAGVDIDAGNQLVKAIGPIARRTRRPEVMTGLGGFGSLFQLPKGYSEPVLVAGTDGVGTKLKLAHRLDRHDTIGIDLVAMCVNDIVVTGAEPLFFLDYFATSRLQVEHATAVIEGIATGCELAGASLVGGETAEMPGMYSGDDYDLAGFCVGIVERDNMIDFHNVQPSNVVLGLASSGLHSNGFSLVNQIIDDTDCDLSQPLQVGNQSADHTDSANADSLGDTLLTPTRIYVKGILAAHAANPVMAVAHITGGGLVENIVRVVPDHCDVHLDTRRWNMPAVFSWLTHTGRVSLGELQRTFNCGIGMVMMVDKDAAGETINVLATEGIEASIIGEVTEGEGKVHIPTHPSI